MRREGFWDFRAGIVEEKGSIYVKYLSEVRISEFEGDVGDM